jgi:hypothetical protein
MAGAMTIGCGGNPPAAPAPCDQRCKDGVALRALRETMRVVYNFTLQANPIGMQRGVFPCLQGGMALVFGEATSNAQQGATNVNLTYVFDRCLHTNQPNPNADRNYQMTFTGTATQIGMITVQPTATTAINIKSMAMTMSGIVYDPPSTYEESDCAVEVTQDGNTVSGFLCGRAAGFGF